MADRIDTGGPAFPVAETRDQYGNGLQEGSSGMTLRDYFAGQVLAGLVAYPGRQNETNAPEHFARWAYAVSDAMIAERSKTEAE